jgi:hypothetical protein
MPNLVDTTEATPPTVVQGNSTYDHILFETNFLTEYTGTHGVTLFDQTMFGGDTAAARLAGSDHRPVWIQMRVSGRKLVRSPALVQPQDDASAAPR